MAFMMWSPIIDNERYDQLFSIKFTFVGTFFFWRELIMFRRVKITVKCQRYKSVDVINKMMQIDEKLTMNSRVPNCTYFCC